MQECGLLGWLCTLSPCRICTKPFQSCRKSICPALHPGALAISGGLWPIITCRWSCTSAVALGSGKRGSPAKSHTCCVEILWQPRNWAGVKRSHTGCFRSIIFQKAIGSFKPCEKKSLLNIPLRGRVLIQVFILSLIPEDTFLFPRPLTLCHHTGLLHGPSPGSPDPEG